MTEFLVIGAVYLAAMVFIAPLSARLGFGSVLGYLGAGVIIGPVMGLPGHVNGELQHFAEFGVVMMMFIIGLEVRPDELWGMRGRLVGMGGAQLLLTGLAAGGISYALGQDLGTCVVVGMVVSLSSTAIVMQTFQERRLSHTAGGQASFAILLAQDIGAILMLLALPILGGRAATDEHPNLLDGLSPAAAVSIGLISVLGVVAAGRWLIPFLARFVHGARMREMDAALALFVVVGISAAMSLVGLSPALGAFLAGVMLAESDMRHDLEAHIEPYKGILLGIFFMTVGAGMDVKMLMSMPLIIIGATLITIVLKAVILNLIARAARLAPYDRSLVTLSLAQAGEFGLVVTSVALTLAVISPTTASGLTLVIALSMILTPALFWIHGKVVKRFSPEAGVVHDQISQGTPTVIIAGLGRFGQVVNRLSDMSGLRVIVLDPNAETVRLARSYGITAYYGNPALPGVLEHAGIRNASAVAVCTDDDDSTVDITRLARRAAPDIRIIARARDLDHACRLRAAGADEVIKEVVDSALRASCSVLRASGVHERSIEEAVAVYRQAEEDSWDEIFDAWDPKVPSFKNPAFLAARQRSIEGRQAVMAEAIETVSAENEGKALPWDTEGQEALAVAKANAPDPVDNGDVEDLIASEAASPAR